MDLNTHNFIIPYLDTWFIKNAKQAGGSGSAKTYVVFDDDTPVGYYSLTVGQVEQSEVPDRVAQGMGNYSTPVIILGRVHLFLTGRDAHIVQI